MSKVGKEYYRGRLSAFNSMLATAVQINKSSLEIHPPVHSDFIQALETLVLTTAENMEYAPDYGVENLKAAMKMVGEYLIDSSKD